MSIPEAQRRKLLVATADSAIALLEDLSHLRDVIKRVDPVRGELRRLSSVLRRLLVDRDLTKIAAPRMGRFLFSAPDNLPILKAEGNRPYEFFGSGGVAAFGVQFRASIVETGSKKRDLPNFDPERVVKMRLDGFLAQPVLCFEGKWLSRGAVIKYVANIASGVHSGTAETEEEKSLSRVRRAMTYAVEDRVTSFIFNPQALGGNTPPPLRYSPEAIDPAMVELLAAVRFLLESEDLATLEAIISAEINA